jgi:transposase
MILLSGDGESVPKIANIVKRNPHTVRGWLKRYKDSGITGLSRKFSPGRPGEKRELVKKRIKEIIKFSPEKKGESLTYFGCLNLRTKKFYWKRSNNSNSVQFNWFLTQLRQQNPSKEIAIILDNASIHKSKKVKEYLERHPNIHLFYLPPYSPEYNPVELFWKWIKPTVYGFVPLAGIQGLIKRFRKCVWHYNNEFMINPINFNFEVYSDLL